MRNANVTPSGMPASTKPMNSGTAEHEQNGVTTPKPAAATVPADGAPTGKGGADTLRREVRAEEATPRSRCRGGAGVPSERRGGRTRPRRRACDPRSNPKNSYAAQFASGRFTNQATNQPATATPVAGQNGRWMRRNARVVIGGRSPVGPARRRRPAHLARSTPSGRRPCGDSPGRGPPCGAARGGC